MGDKPTYKELEKENTLIRKKLKSKNSDDKFDSFFLNNKAVMFEVDAQTKKILKVNKAAIDFYGFSGKEFCEKNMNDLNTLPPNEIKKLMSKAVNNKSNFFKLKHKLADGQIKDVEVYASPFPYDNKIHIFVTIVDKSNEKQAEEKLKKQNEEYAALNEEYVASNEELTEKNNEYSALNEEYKSQNEELTKAKNTAI